MKQELSNEHTNRQRREERAAHWGDPARVRLVTPGGWFDGSLKPYFDAIGQDFVILHNEVRELPADLLERCITSGAQFERVQA